MEIKQQHSMDLQKIQEQVKSFFLVDKKLKFTTAVPIPPAPKNLKKANLLI